VVLLVIKDLQVLEAMLDHREGMDQLVQEDRVEIEESKVMSARKDLKATLVPREIKVYKVISGRKDHKVPMA
jgi:hypothetical protein